MIISGCSSSLPSVPQLPKLKVYKIDVAQGNIVDANQLARLAVGMPKRHVRVLLGTPLVQDPFHPERWDYIYNLQPGGEARQQRQITLFFNDQNELLRLEGDISGQLRQTPLQIASTKTTVNVPALAKVENVGFWRGLRRRLPFSGDRAVDETVETVSLVAPQSNAPTIAPEVDTDNEKIGFWGGLRQRLPFIGNKEKGNDVDAAEVITPAARSTVAPTNPQQPARTAALQPRAIVAEQLVPGKTTIDTTPGGSPGIATTAPTLEPGMSLSELNPADDSTEPPPEEQVETLDNQSGLFDGLLRKIGG